MTFDKQWKACRTSVESKSSRILVSQFNNNLAAREPEIANDMHYAVEITDKNSKRNKQCAYMYIDAGRDVLSGLGVTVLVGNGVGQSLSMNSTFSCVSWVLARKW